MLQERTRDYQDEWKAKGKDAAPTEDEWYEIADARDSDEVFVMVGEPFNGSDWPFVERPGMCKAFCCTSNRPLTSACCSDV